jgi:hypothetical protein
MGTEIELTLCHPQISPPPEPQVRRIKSTSQPTTVKRQATAPDLNRYVEHQT